MVPHTRDGRVMFAIPWHGHTLVGTTDTPIDAPTLEPRPLDSEIDFILETAGRYLHTAPTRADMLQRVRRHPPAGQERRQRITAALSRDHTIHIDASGLLTITGGKWTTYRKMAEDSVDQAADLARLPERPCVTRTLNIHGFHQHPATFGALGIYGTDALGIRALIRDNPSLLAAARRAALHPRRGGVGHGARDGADGRGRAGAPHARVVSQCTRRDRDGTGGGGDHGAVAGAGRSVGIRTDRGVSNIVAQGYC